MTPRVPVTVGAVVIAGMLLLGAPGPAAASHFGIPVAGWWPLNEPSGQVVYDWSGHGNHGRLGATAHPDANDPARIRGRFGFGYALDFGGDDFVTIPDSSSLEPRRLTVESWFRRHRSPGKHRYLVAKGGDDCHAGSYGLSTGRHGGVWFYVYDGDVVTRSPQAKKKAIWDGEWHHAAGTFDGTTVRLFIDGKEVGDGSAGGGPVEYNLPQQQASVGAYRASCSLLFDGDVDGVRIWSRALPVESIFEGAQQLRDALGGR